MNPITIYLRIPLDDVREGYRVIPSSWGATIADGEATATVDVGLGLADTFLNNWRSFFW